MVRRKYAKLYCWLRLSYANPAQHCPFLALDRTSVSVVPSWSKKSKSRSTCKQLGPMSEPQSLQPLASVIVSIFILDKQANGRCPLEPTSTTHFVAGVSPENRFMNLLNSDRFSLVKRWEGDINPPSFIVPDATGSTLIVGRDLRLKKKCSIRVEPPLMPPLPSLMLSPTTCCWSSSSNQNAGGALELKSSTPSTLASVSRMRNCDILDYYRK